MRILRIRFRNLNSLAGDWEIDLTHPAFTSDGIFAITGPTGAGKTTILDAVCLALYGRTPRLDKVTRGGNEIMSRQTGECFAEVTFETQAGRYRCQWSQRRARKHPWGELQAPQHELVDADTGEVLETRLRTVAQAIETATGMDFQRFTRSMLLAQGGFAAFLQAPPDERAPILEQITGTEIYSRISIRVHERRAGEQKRLKTMQDELAGMPLLRPEEEQRLAAALDEKIRAAAHLAARIDWTTQAVAWIEGMARLEEELRAIGRSQEGLHARTEAFAPDQARLDAALRALGLDADHAALQAARTAQEEDQRALQACRDALPARTAAAVEAEAAMKIAEGRLAVEKAAQQAAQPVLRKVRELDLKIAEKDAAIGTASASLQELTDALGALQADRRRDSEELDRHRATLRELGGLLESTRADEALVEHLAGIRGRFENLQDLTSQLTRKGDEVAQAEQGTHEAAGAAQDREGRLADQRRALAETQAALEEKNTQLLALLEGRSLADWRRSQSLLAAQNALVTKALDAERNRAQSQQADLALARRQETLGAEASTLDAALKGHEERQAALEKEQELLETQRLLLERIADLAEARAQLRDGEPCPLCGAVEHPFAAGNVPLPDETRLRLTEVRASMKSNSAELSRTRVTQAELRKDLQQIASERKEHASRIAEASLLIGEICAALRPELGISASDTDLNVKLEALQSDHAQRLERATAVLEAADAAENELATLRESLEKARDAEAKAERDAQSAAHAQQSAAQQLERLRSEAVGLRTRQDEALGRLRKEVQVFGVEELRIEGLGKVLEQLDFRRAQWLSRQEERRRLERAVNALEMQTRHQAGEIEKSQKDVSKQRNRLDALQGEREALARERQDLFGDKSADREEARLSTAVQAAEQALEAARRESDEAREALTRLRTRTGELEKDIDARGRSLASSEQAFQERLRQIGFPDEDHYRAARLPDVERRRLEEQSRKLADEKTVLAGREREKAEYLDSERRKAITTEPLHGLKRTLEDLGAEQKEFQEEIGGIRQKLKDNEALKQRQQDRAREIEAQQRECKRWDLLHLLIGSADGKKYRNFAQGLTFEIMIGHANRQLRKMTDRYLLVRDSAQPLELNVIDSYQAGEERSTRNLSGGESFIVSLALALGLSHMASRNVRVDSLFLDEGFGTLDEESLDTAIETLAGLQQDGKLIGVISHVSALKERIATQIQVKPQTGGRSRISGPGTFFTFSQSNPGHRMQPV